MIVTVEYFGQLQHITGCRTEPVEIADGTDVRALIKHLAERYGERFRDFVFAADGQLRKSIPILIDDRQTRAEQAPPLREGARLMILSPIAGG